MAVLGVERMQRREEQRVIVWDKRDEARARDW
jgi:hypothetical protein